MSKQKYLDKVNKALIVISSDVSLVSPVDKKPSSEAVAEYLEGRKKYEELRTQKRKKGSNREEQVNNSICGHHLLNFKLMDQGLSLLICILCIDDV